MILRFETIASSVLILLIQCALTRSHLRGSTEPMDEPFQTALLPHPLGTFSPLECNADLDQAECKPWSSIFGSDDSTIFNRRITIPCGQCVEIDYQVWGRNLVLHNGLDVQGKLVFPPNSHLHVKTTSLLVQGELHMYSAKIINGLPAVTISWIDPPETPRRPLSFRPPVQNHTSTNPYPCGSQDFEECDLGERPFVVAGGKVVIKGWPSSDTPSWVSLLDVDDSKTGWHVPEFEYQPYIEPSDQPGCPSNGKLIHHTFTEPPPNYISGSWGAFTEWTGDSLKMTRRSHQDHGFVIDTREIRHCLSVKATYLVTAKVRIPARGQGLTQCATMGKNCMKLVTRHRNASAEEQTRDRWIENESHRTQFGNEITVHAELKFFEEEFGETSSYEIFHLQGPGPGEDMELLEFTLELPPREAFANPDTICANLVPANGDAELFSFSSFPFRTNSDYIQIRTAYENLNRYFQVSGRDVLQKTTGSDDSEDDRNKYGITWSIPPSCVKAKATYRFRAKVRVHSDTPVAMEWSVHGKVGRRSHFSHLARCPVSQGQWVQCKGGLITFSNDIVHSHHNTAVAETLGNSLVDYDVDDISLELVDGPVDRLILPSTIKNHWAKGAHLLITSQSPVWDAWEAVQIVAISDHDDESVKVEISRPIQSPVSAKDSRHYATEVALLSRNILFQGGGHFTVLHTPDVPQIIEGADFDGWGVAGVRDRYPIHFDNCQDSKGTIVAKNTIRHSRQRGIVLHSTDNIQIESNVAFNVTGHCFALESGLEQGNTFEGNLGVYNQAARHLMPKMGASGVETDDFPATFWITNPQNNFIGNVATGSEGHGFWLQLRESPRGPHSLQDDVSTEATNQLALGIFENNAIHSVNASAVRVTGYHPVTEAKIVGLRVYWNDNDTFEVRDSTGLTVFNGIFDKPLAPPTGVTVKNALTMDVRGCSDEDDEAAATMLNAVSSSSTRTDNQHPGALDTPSAPFVFGLQEFESR